jgi:hypothetical protein
VHNQFKSPVRRQAQDLKERIGIADSASGHLLRMAFRHPVEEHAVKNVFSGDPDSRRAGSAGKGKGCDIGYALAISSCEGASSVETCTVTAL